MQVKANPLFKTANNIDEAISFIKSELSLFDQNQVHSLLMMFQNTILKELDAHHARTPHECSVGVGDGTGDLFVYGKYEAVKRVQNMIFELEKLRDKEA